MQSLLGQSEHDVKGGVLHRRRGKWSFLETLAKCSWGQPLGYWSWETKDMRPEREILSAYERI